MKKAVLVYSVKVPQRSRMAGFPRVRGRLNLTSVSNICEAAQRCMFVLGPNGLDELPQVRN